MKKYLVAFFVTILALASCAKDLDEGRINDDNTSNGANTVLTFTSERPELDPSTKTAWDADLNGKGGIVWSENDKIRVGFTFNGNWWGQAAAGSDIKFYQSNGVSIDPERHNIGTFTVPVGPKAFSGPTSSGDFVFYAIYPDSAINSASQNNAPEMKVTLNSNQTPSEDSFDPSTDILVGKSKTVTSTGLPSEHIDLYWTRVVAHGMFTLKNFQGVEPGEKVHKVIFTAQNGANLTGKQIVSVEDGTLRGDGNGTSNAVTLYGNNLSFVTEEGNTNLKVWLSVMPITLTALDVEVETNKATYHRSFTGIERSLEGNRRNTMGINMATAEKTSKPQYYWIRRDLAAIAPNDVLVIVGNNGNTYAMSNNKGTGSAPSAVPVTVSDDGTRLEEPVPETIQWTLGRDGTKYTFSPVSDNTKYLYCTTSNAALYVGTGSNRTFSINDGYLYNEMGWLQSSRYVGISGVNDWRSYTSINSTIRNQSFAFYVRVDADSYSPQYDITFENGTTYTTTVNNYSGSFVNTCDGLSLTLVNINNSNNTVMYAGGYNDDPRVASITTNDAITEAIKTVTLSVTQVDVSKLYSARLIVSPTSDFEPSNEYSFNITGAGDASVTIPEPAANMYYRIEIDLDGSSGWDFIVHDPVGNFRFDAIVFATE